MEILVKRSSDETPVKPCCHGNSMATVQATEMSIWFFRHNPHWLQQTSPEVDRGSSFLFFCSSVLLDFTLIFWKKITILCLRCHIHYIFPRNTQHSVLCVQYNKFQCPSNRFIIHCLQHWDLSINFTAVTSHLTFKETFFIKIRGNKFGQIILSVILFCYTTLCPCVTVFCPLGETYWRRLTTQQRIPEDLSPQKRRSEHLKYRKCIDSFQ